MQNNTTVFLKASSLSHYMVCPKRSKLESFFKIANYRPTTGAIHRGNRFHYIYSYMLRDFDRDLLMESYKLKYRKYSRSLKMDNLTVIVIGKLDDLVILRYHDKKYSVIKELFTTGKEYPWSTDILMKSTQLKLYCWMYGPLLKYLGYPLWKRSYVEVYSQKSGTLLRRVAVEYNEEVEKELEEWIKYVVRSFQGIERMKVPHQKICKSCPKIVRLLCNWYKQRFGKYE